MNQLYIVFGQVVIIVCSIKTSRRFKKTFHIGRTGVA